MGAVTFGCYGAGKTANEAFRTAVDAARERYGNDGYTGSIAEKKKFVMIPVPSGKEPVSYANELLDGPESEDLFDKWGPAGCVEIGCDVWYFFGWAPE